MNDNNKMFNGIESLFSVELVITVGAIPEVLFGCVEPDMMIKVGLLTGGLKVAVDALYSKILKRTASDSWVNRINTSF